MYIVLIIITIKLPFLIIFFLSLSVFSHSTEQLVCNPTSRPWRWTVSHWTPSVTSRRPSRDSRASPTGWRGVWTRPRSSKNETRPSTRSLRSSGWWSPSSTIFTCRAGTGGPGTALRNGRWISLEGFLESLYGSRTITMHLHILYVNYCFLQV